MPDHSISRRQLLSRSLLTGLSASFLSNNIAWAEEKKELLWFGVTFMRSCPKDSGSACEGMNAYFPHTWPTLNYETGDQTKKKKLEEIVPKLIQDPTGKNNNLKITLMTPENDYGGDVKTDLGIFVGISSDRDIAHKYERLTHQVTQFAELQTYVIVFDVEQYKIIQSYPIRFLRLETIAGKSRKGLIEKIQWQTLTGENRKGKSLPDYLAEATNKLVINRQRPVGIRVTEVTLKKRAKKWLSTERTASGNQPRDYEEILGNTLTTAVSEKLGIGMQPFIATKSIMNVTLGMTGKSTKTLDKDFNTAPIDWDIRLTAYGTFIKDTKVKGYKSIFDRRIMIGIGITVGKYQRFFEGDNPNNEEIRDKQKAIEIIFKQNLSAVSVERTGGKWSNNWAYTLDLHTRLFEWFFENMKKQKYEFLFRGEQQNLETRKFLTKVRSKDFTEFEAQSKRLRKILLG